MRRVFFWIGAPAIVQPATSEQAREMNMRIPRTRLQRWLAGNGALLAATAVALAAYASHGVDGVAQARLQTAALFAFGHGIALVALAPQADTWSTRAALLSLYAGTLLFAGSLVLGAIAQWPTTLAPMGGFLLIGGWLALAFDAMRR